MIPRVLMVQGTTSDAGKSTLVAGLCRWLYRRGLRVAPFKPQNMALNSAVTVDGGEIGRAQALQALACGLAPHTDMNPILLKPNTDIGAQVIVHGHSIGSMDALDYHAYKSTARNAVLTSFSRLYDQYDAVVVEGAGSPAEINLRHNDIANMGFAEAVDCPVVLVADIDRGGVFAHLVGTLALLAESEQRRVCGFVINRFRGDLSLLQSGLDWLETETGKPVLGVLPYLNGLHVDAEDALPRIDISSDQKDQIRVVVPAFPRISNHTDFDPLRAHPQVNFRFVGPGESFPTADLVILPGSKSVRTDLEWLRAQAWEPAIKRHLRYGGKLIGICGGFQMLGNSIHDVHGVEGMRGTTCGLALFDMETRLESEKQLRNVTGELAGMGPQGRGVAVSGYEIHSGVSRGTALERPAVYLEHGPDGAASDDGQVFGTYVHGLFESAAACAALLNWVGIVAQEVPDYDMLRMKSVDRLADACETHLDTTALDKIIGLGVGS